MCYFDNCAHLLNHIPRSRPLPGQIKKLANLEVGGTKGKVLTTSVTQIHLDFGLAVAGVKEVDFDIMDLDKANDFEAGFQTFR